MERNKERRKKKEKRKVNERLRKMSTEKWKKERGNVGQERQRIKKKLLERKKKK